MDDIPSRIRHKLRKQTDQHARQVLLNSLIEQTDPRLKTDRTTKPYLPGAEAPLRFPEPIWRCRVCKWRFGEQARPDRCPMCNALFSFELIKTEEQMIDEFRLDKSFKIRPVEKSKFHIKSDWDE